MSFKNLATCTALLLALAHSSFAAETVRVVPCDQPIKSRKRGLCINKASAEDFLALAPTVSWYYSWHFADTNNAPAQAGITFIPMAWGNHPENVKGLADYLRTHKPPFVLGINEPNLKGQAFINPEITAQLYQKIKAVADTYHIPTIGPNMALGSGSDASISADDPIEKKKVTYTFMTPFLKAFFHYVGSTEVSATSSHTYGNSGELKWMVEMMHKEFNRPVWVTEFADWHAKNEDAERQYLIESVDFLERTPYVQGYAWFKERVEGNPKLSLLANESGKLTKLGETYVQMPVHDADLFYRLPGRLGAERYVAMQGADIAPTTDAEGFLEMRCLDASDWIEYNIAVPQAGSFAFNARFSTMKDGKVEILSKDKILASVEASDKGWQTGSGTIGLPAGTQTIRVRCTEATRLNWIEFSRR
jgi:hypothetical protein